MKTEGNFGNRWQRKVAPCLDDAAACLLMIELDRALRHGEDEDSHKQYMDTVALKALVTGFQKEVGHATPGRCSRDVGFRGSMGNQNHYMD